MQKNPMNSNTMNVLILGSGGREHALAEAISKGGHKVVVAPGNGGIESLFECQAVDPCDATAVVALAQKLQSDLVVIGPEAPLVAGVADQLRQKNIAVFGPGATGAQLEGSKIFARHFMEKAQVAQPAFHVCETSEQVTEVLAQQKAPFVIKADGLAAGKGVVVTDDRAEAFNAAKEILSGKFGKAGTRILIEEGLVGEEISLFVLTDGQTYHCLPLCQDHKRIFDEDKGPNTGGMGAICPVPWVSDVLYERLIKRIVEPTIQGLQDQKIDFSGMLFIGIMVGDSGNPLVLEYNTRFGDPETEVLLPALEEEWGAVLYHTALKSLKDYHFTAKPKAAATVVLAAENYPATPITGEELKPYTAQNKKQKLYYSGVTKNNEGALVTKGGRVLAATGVGRTLKEALGQAYALADKQSFKNVQIRTDIGRKTMERSPKIGVIMGSSSDVPLLDKCAQLLKEFGVPFEGKIASAHRTPEEVVTWVENASEKGIEVIIAAAGLSAALPGVVAAHTHLPVIGLPVESGALKGVDALYSIAQMPPGVPVASVGINGAVNAALQALRICAIHDESLKEKLSEYQKKAAQKVISAQSSLAHW